MTEKHTLIEAIETRYKNEELKETQRKIQFRHQQQQEYLERSQNGCD